MEDIRRTEAASHPCHRINLCGLLRPTGQHRPRGRQQLFGPRPCLVAVYKGVATIENGLIASG